MSFSIANGKKDKIQESANYQYVTEKDRKTCFSVEKQDFEQETECRAN